MTGLGALPQERDFLLAQRGDYRRACGEFAGPLLDRFNWALDYSGEMAAGRLRLALWIVDENGGETRRMFNELSARSNCVANFLRSAGVRRGDRALVMVGNQAPLWAMLLAAMKLGVVVIPAASLSHLGPPSKRC